jgi:hypothetical protein
VRCTYRLQALAVLKLRARFRRREIVKAEATDVHHTLVQRLVQIDEISAYRTVMHLHRNKTDTQAPADDGCRVEREWGCFAAHFGGVERVLVRD